MVHREPIDSQRHMPGMQRPDRRAGAGQQVDVERIHPLQHPGQGGQLIQSLAQAAARGHPFEAECSSVERLGPIALEGLEVALALAEQS